MAQRDARGCTGRRWARGALLLAGWLMARECVGLPNSAVGADDLRSENERLRRQVGYLTEALVRTRIEADRLRAQADRSEFEKAGGSKESEGDSDRTLTVTEFMIRAVSRDLSLVVLDGGRRQGIRLGMRFRVVRGDRTVARVRVIDARALMAGAVIEERDLGMFPAAGDRAVIGGSRKE